MSNPQILDQKRQELNKLREEYHEKYQALSDDILLLEYGVKVGTTLTHQDGMTATVKQLRHSGRSRILADVYSEEIIYLDQIGNLWSVNQ